MATVKKLLGGEVLFAAEAIIIIAPERMNMDATVHVKEIRRAISAIATDVNDIKTGLITEYGAVNEKGQKYINAECEGWPLFLAEYTKLLEKEFELNTSLIPLSIKELWRHSPDPKASGERITIDVSADTLEKLGPLLLENQTSDAE